VLIPRAKQVVDLWKLPVPLIDCMMADVVAAELDRVHERIAGRTLTAFR